MNEKNISQVGVAMSPAVIAANEAGTEEVSGNISKEFDVDVPQTLDTATQSCDDPNPPPNSLKSSFEVFKSAGESRSFLQCMDFCLICLKGKVVDTILMIVTTAIRIASIVLGSVFLHDCPVKPSIPQYLIIGGVIGVVRNLIIVILQMTENVKIQKLKSLSSFFSGYLVVWFIVGCVWIYQVYEPNYVDPNNANYCHRVLYLFSFWLLNSTFIFIGALMILNIVIACIKFRFDLKKEIEQPEPVTEQESKVGA